MTNMAQYAIRGYEVDALDYVLKPVNYYQFLSLIHILQMTPRATPFAMTRPISRPSVRRMAHSARKLSLIHI